MRVRGILAWFGGQVGALVLALVHALVLGPVLAIRRGEFHGRTFAVTTLVLLLAAALAGWTYTVDVPALHATRDVTLWLLFLAGAAVAGYNAGLRSRHIALWEIYLATLLVLGVLFVHLSVGWPLIAREIKVYVLQLMGEQARDGHPGFWRSLNDSRRYGDIPFGPKYLGPMWDRMLALGIVAGFGIAMTASSLALLRVGGALGWRRGLTFEWMVGRRHLFGEKRVRLSITAAVAVLGVGLGVAALIAVTAVMSGYQKDVQDKILTTNSHLVVQKYGVDFVEYEEISKKALAIEGVEAATTFVFNEALLSVGDESHGILIKGIVPETAGAVTRIAHNLCMPERDPATNRIERCPYADAASADANIEALDQALSTRDGVPSVIVGSELARKLGADEGTIVTLTTPVGIAGARGNAPRRMRFRLGGAFRSGMHEFDVRLVYMSQEAAQELFGMGGAVNGVELRVADPQNVDLTATAVLRAVGHYPYRTLDWRELNASIFTALKLQKIVMFLVLTFIVIVAAFNIASTLFMTVVERSHEIAVLKSMGAHDASVMKIFVVQGWMVGLIGTTLGVLLGLGIALFLGELDIQIAADVYMVESLHVLIRPLEVALTAGSALLISHLATIYPALRAARQKPVDAMRYD